MFSYISFDLCKLIVVAALTDICERTPNIPLCNWYKVAATGDSQLQTVAFTQPVTIFESTTLQHFVDTTTVTYPTDGVTDGNQNAISNYCYKYRSHYGVFCSKPSTDVDINLYCSSYNSQCHPEELFTTIPASGVDAFQTAAPPAIGSAAGIGNYCDKYKAHFAYHCTNGVTGNPDVDVFCNTYIKVCNPILPSNNIQPPAGLGLAAGSASTDLPDVNSGATPAQLKEYCNQYRKHYAFYCNSKSDSVDVNLFCQAYVLKCV